MTTLKRAHLGVILLATLIALITTRPQAYSSNDGSRLAIVEAIVDHGTLAVDESIFIKVPENIAPHPYTIENEYLREYGTIDKIKVGEHFYSDKPYTPYVITAGAYQLLQWTTGLKAKEHATWFCYLMTFISAGIPYVIAVWGVFCFGGLLNYTLILRLILTASFGLGTLAWPYCACANCHIILLAVSVWLTYALMKMAMMHDEGGLPGWKWFLLVGALTGFAYSSEQGIGQLLWGWTGLLLLLRYRKIWPIVLYVVASFPFLATHHAINYQIGGTWKPANSVPEYFKYEGSAFDETTLTGGWNHENFGDFLLYAAGLLVGEKGFLRYNFGLWLAIPGIVLCWRARALPRWELSWMIVWSISTWLLYSALSNNKAGYCLSIRWFIPLLGPLWFVLAKTIQQWPGLAGDFVLLTAFSIILGVFMAWIGPWMDTDLIGNVIQPIALAVWGIYRFCLHRANVKLRDQS